jgi:Ca2+-binding EF-hand superfamily protein
MVACEEKYNAKWQALLDDKAQLARQNMHILPIGKGAFHSAGNFKWVPKKPVKRKAAMASEPLPLPDEKTTAVILNAIHPIQSSASVREDDDVDTRTPRMDGRKSLASTLMSQSPSPPVSPAKSAGGMVSALSGSLNFNKSATGRSNVGKTEAQDVMIRFRQMLVDQFSTVQNAFECFRAELPRYDPSSEGVSRNEWRMLLQRHGFACNRTERTLIFDQLDANGNGVIDIDEFHFAVQAVAPIGSLEDVRRRWLALGYTSMVQVFNVLDGDGAAYHNRLSLSSFGQALMEVSVEDPREHEAIFNIVAARSESGERATTISIAELASAMATISPSLLLEEVRRKLLTEYQNNVERAFWDFDKDHGGTISCDEFVAHTTKKWGFTEIEAFKAFRDIDIDGSGSISRMELLASLGLAEASLFTEDLRLKVRQRSKSIQQAFVDALEDELMSIFDAPKMTLNTFQDSLKPIGFTEREISVVFQLMDTEVDGALSFGEFLKGMKHFAPSCFLDDLASLVTQQGLNVAELFSESRCKPLPVRVFAEMLNAAGLSEGIRVQTVFDILDARCIGEVSMGQLVAALQCVPPGSAPKPQSADSDRHAEKDVRDDFAHMRKFATDLRNQVRKGADFVAPSRIASSENGSKRNSLDGANVAEALLGPSTKRGSVVSFVSGQKAGTSEAIKLSQQPAHLLEENALEGTDSKRPAKNLISKVGKGSNSAPKLKIAHATEIVGPDMVKHPTKGSGKKALDPVGKMQRSWENMWKSLHGVAVTEGSIKSNANKMERGLHVYYQTASWRLSHDTPLLQRSQSVCTRLDPEHMMKLMRKQRLRNQ